MRTKLDLPENLLNEAVKLMHIGTKVAVIIKALEELVRKSKITELKRYRGKIDLEMNLRALRGRH